MMTFTAVCTIKNQNMTEKEFALKELETVVNKLGDFLDFYGNDLPNKQLKKVIDKWVELSAIIEEIKEENQ